MSEGCCDLRHDATMLLETLDFACDMTANIDLTEEEFFEVMDRIEKLQETAQR
jgi:hypothetical protein